MQARYAMRVRNVYRGHVVSLREGVRDVEVEFHRLPVIKGERSSFPRDCSSGSSGRRWGLAARAADCSRRAGT